MVSDAFTPRPEHKFTFGLWTVGNRGRDPFGDAVRPTLLPVEAVRLLAEVGAMGVNLHDNDLVPIDATPTQRDRIVREFKDACESHNLKVPMATVNLFYDAVFRDAAVHRQRSQRARLCFAENDESNGPWRRTRRGYFRALGRARGHGDRRMPPPGNFAPNSIFARNDALSLPKTRFRQQDWERQRFNSHFEKQYSSRL